MAEILSQEPRRLGYQPALDGLRAVAVLAVFGYHVTGSGVPGGYIGVDLFFVLSGFLITCLLLEERQRTGRVSLSAFYMRRFLRLVPALVVFLACYLVCFALFSPKRFPIGLKSAGLAITYLANWSYTLGVTDMGWVGHTWSLSVEEQFYLLWPPLLLLGFWLVPSRRGLMGVLAGGIVVVMIHRSLGASLGWRAGRLYGGLDTRADALLLGCLAAFIYNMDLLRGEARLQRGLGGLALLSLAGLLAFCFRGLDRYLPAMFHGGYTLVALASALLILGLASGAPGTRQLGRLLTWSPLTWLGRISYGVYLWHFLVVWFLREAVPPLSVWVRLPLALAATLALASLSFILVERPFLRMKKRFTPGAGRTEVTAEAPSSIEPGWHAGSASSYRRRPEPELTPPVMLQRQEA